jgi:CDP-diacylglycerol--serine O-phosphatidyltransferase
MVSEVRYPSFKALDLRARRNFYITLIASLLFAGAVILQEKLLRFVLPLFFTAYLAYGFFRPHISRRLRREIEVDDEWEGEEPDDPDAPPPSPPPAF